MFNRSVVVVCERNILFIFGCKVAGAQPNIQPYVSYFLLLRFEVGFEPFVSLFACFPAFTPPFDLLSKI